MVRWLSICAGLVLLSGCGTLGSVPSGCSGPYSGLRFDGDLLGTYRAELLAAREVPLGIDGWLANGFDSAMVAVDAPLSALTDTLAAPFTWALGQETPEPVGLGCRWAAPAAYWGSVSPREP